jgi:hypothetical protein
MPLIATRGSASAVSFGFLSAQSKLYWVGLLGGAVTTRGFTGAYDSTGAFVVGGQSFGTTNNVGQLAKFSPTGGLIWQKNVVPTSTITNPSISVASLAVDALNNIYTGINATDGSNNRAYYAQCTSEGVLEQSRNLAVQNNTFFSGFSITRPLISETFPTRPPLVSVVSGGASGGELVVAQLNVNTWALTYRTMSSIRVSRLAPLAYASEISYVIGAQNIASAGVFIGQLGNFFASGQQIPAVGLTGSIAGLAIIGASYYAGHIYDSVATLHRFDSLSSGPVWSRRFNTAASFSSIASDAEGYVYACTSSGLLVKYSASGVLQWQRAFTCVGGSVSLNTVVVDAEGTIGVVGSVDVSGAVQLFVARVPSTGGATNTVNVGGVTVTYAASSFTEDTAATTWSATSYDSADTSRTVLSPGATVTATTLGVAVERL